MSCHLGYICSSVTVCRDLLRLLRFRGQVPPRLFLKLTIDARDAVSEPGCRCVSLALVEYIFSELMLLAFLLINLVLYTAIRAK